MLFILFHQFDLIVSCDDSMIKFNFISAAILFPSEGLLSVTSESMLPRKKVRLGELTVPS